MDRVEDQGTVLDRSRDRPELVHRPREAHATVPADATKGWAQPEAPQARQGETILPRVSLPIAKPTRPAATAEAEPADEPLDPVRGSHGLFVRPPNQRSPIASAPSDSLATSTAPASSSRAATVALTSITRSLKGVAPHVVGYPG